MSKQVTWRSTVKDWLKATGHYQWWLAEEVRIKPAYLSGLLGGAASPSGALLVRLEEVIGVKLGTLWLMYQRELKENSDG
ncbi:hypothetical protein CMI37_33295 [Candidatus Pacearchaeota archaeon]|nr:hypothetical protein [Candidatus Pacearchaeota archaeon]